MTCSSHLISLGFCVLLPKLEVVLFHPVSLRGCVRTTGKVGGLYRITEKITAAHKITVSSTRTGSEKCWKTNRADLEYTVGSRVTGRRNNRRQSMTSLHCVHLAQDTDSEGGWAAGSGGVLNFWFNFARNPKLQPTHLKSGVCPRN